MSNWHRTDFDFLPLEAFRPRPGGGMRLHGGSNSTPPPDPELVDAQIGALNTQAGATEAMTAAQMALVPLQMEQMRFGLMAAETAYNDSREDRAYALDRRSHLTTLQDRMISEATDYNTEAAQEEAASTAMADVSTQFSAAQGAQRRNLTRMGVNPDSGNYAAMENQNSLGLASAQAGAANAGRAAARQEGYTLTDRATSALSGYPTFGANATQMSMNNGLSGINAANQGASGIISGYNAIGAGAARTGSTAAGLYNAQLNAYGMGEQAAATEEAGQWGAVGAAAGTIALYAI